MLVIFDGLDECEDRNERRIVLKTIFEAVPRLRHRLKFLIASRPEFDIQSFFELVDIKNHVNIVELQADARAYDDVRRYLQDSFCQVKQTHPLRATFKPDWPSTQSIEELVEKSSGHFIYASTIIKYIDSPYARPTRRLEEILGLHTTSRSPYANLDVLYNNILTSGSSKLDRRLFMDILSTALVGSLVDYVTYDAFILARSDRFVESLLSLEPGEVLLAFIDLKSLVLLEETSIYTPSSSRVSRIKFSHNSFVDFLCNPSRAKEFYVDIRQGYATLAQLCLDVVSDHDKLVKR